MDRFFSKLDLRDIKIDPESSFPPDEDAYADVPSSSGEANNGQRASYVNGQSGPASVLETAPVVDGEDLEREAEHGEVLKVSARSRPSAVAGAIAGVVRESGRAEVQAIGAGATNQAVKAVAIARDYLLETGIEAVCLPAFIDVQIEDENRTAIRLIVEPR